jgi:hypothetical protein
MQGKEGRGRGRGRPAYVLVSAFIMSDVWVAAYTVNLMVMHALVRTTRNAGTLSLNTSFFHR